MREEVTGRRTVQPADLILRDRQALSTAQARVVGQMSSARALSLFSAERRGFSILTPAPPRAVSSPAGWRRAWRARRTGASRPRLRVRRRYSDAARLPRARFVVARRPRSRGRRRFSSARVRGRRRRVRALPSPRPSSPPPPAGRRPALAGSSRRTSARARAALRTARTRPRISGRPSRSAGRRGAPSPPRASSWITSPRSSRGRPSTRRSRTP